MLRRLDLPQQHHVVAAAVDSLPQMVPLGKTSKKVAISLFTVGRSLS